MNFLGTNNSKDKSTNFSYNSSNPIDAVSIIGKGMLVEGSIHTDNDIRIDGIVKGEIHCKGKIVMGNNSELTVSVQTDETNINGKFNGNIVASKQVVVGPKGNIEGDITTPNLVVEEGGMINGSVRMETITETNNDYSDS